LRAVCPASSRISPTSSSSTSFERDDTDGVIAVRCDAGEVGTALLHRAEDRAQPVGVADRRQRPDRDEVCCRKQDRSGIAVFELQCTDEQPLFMRVKQALAPRLVDEPRDLVAGERAGDLVLRRDAGEQIVIPSCAAAIISDTFSSDTIMLATLDSERRPQRVALTVSAMDGLRVDRVHVGSTPYPPQDDQDDER
jgi:hypothetical protein